MARRKEQPLRREGDSDAMAKAIDFLQLRGQPVKRVSSIQLKVYDLNYYPDAGTMYFDRGKRLKETGLSGLNKVLCRSLNRKSLCSEPSEITLDI